MNNVENQLYSKVATLLENARTQVVSTVNLTMVITYFEIGRTIIEDEQQGELRAEYGKQVLKELSEKLKLRFGKGFSVDNLQNMRKFFLSFSKYETVSSILQNNDNQLIENKNNTINKTPMFQLSWSHYLVLMRIENLQERRFYEIEAVAQNWSLAQLNRQYHASLYERLALSRDKNEVLKLAKQGQTIEKPQDILKNPLTLDFLGLGEKVTYSETDLEQRIITKLQDFLLELGKGFLFEARQKRFTFDNEHFFVDLVFYNRLLQCYVLIDLKIDKLSHQDLGQMQMYVNYFDRFEKQEFEKPTIGILLCKKKNSNLVELTLPKEANIYASEYSLYLPDKVILQQKLNDWISELEL